jgi:hypothetical protein
MIGGRLPPKRRLAVAAGSGAVLLAAACQLLVPLDEQQCTTTADCVARGAAFAGTVCVGSVCSQLDAEGGPGDADGTDAGAEADAPKDPWACLDLPGLPSSTASVQIEIVTFDAFQPYVLGGSIDGGNDLTFVQGTVTEGVSVKACDSLSPSCGTPTKGPFFTDDAGVAIFSISGTFNGFYLLERSDLFPTLMYAGRLVAGEPSVQYPTSALGKAEAQQLGVVLAVNVNEDPDAGLGHVFFNAFDCDDRHAANVSFKLENTNQGFLFYLLNNYPSTTARGTDPSGAGGVVNIPSGNLVVSATLGSRKIGPLNLAVRPAAASLLYLRPRVHN